jgi:hypothetical protein
MSEIKDMLLKTYLKKGARPATNNQVPESVKKPPKPIPVETPRTMGDITMAMAAQRIYSPDLPPSPPSPKSPSKTMMDQGTGPAMGMDGPWGKPQE